MADPFVSLTSWGDFKEGSEIQRTILELLGDARVAEMDGNDAEAKRFTRYSAFVGELGAEVTRLRSRLHQMEAFLEREHYRRCDIPACNCSSWHRADQDAQKEVK